MRRRGRRTLASIAALPALAILVGCGEPEPRLALLLTVDTLRADRLEPWGEKRDLAPHLDALARESIVFESAWAPTSFTLPSVASMLTGRHPVELGIYANGHALPEDVPTLAGRVRERGWRTGAVVSNYVLRPASGLGRGFEVYDARFPQEEATRGIPERTAAPTTTAALDLLDRLAAAPGRGVFLWVHYQDPHGPYTPPEALRRRLLPEARRAPDGRRTLPASPDQGGDGAIPRYQVLGEHREVAFYRAGYDAEVAFLDREIGRLLQGLRERGWYDDAVIVFAADHGESLGEDDFWFAHGARLSDVLVRVPLFLRVPGRAPARRTEVAALGDLHPTLLALLGAPPDGTGRARDLLAPRAEAMPSEVYLSSLRSGEIARIGLVARDHKIVWTREPRGWRRSPPRRVGGDASHGDAPPGLDDAMAARLRHLAGGGIEHRPPSARTLGEAERRKLRALGYLRGDPDEGDEAGP